MGRRPYLEPRRAVADAGCIIDLELHLDRHPPAGRLPGINSSAGGGSSQRAEGCAAAACFHQACGGQFPALICNTVSEIPGPDFR